MNLVNEILQLQAYTRGQITVLDDPTSTQIEEMLRQYAAANPYSDTYVVTFTKHEHFERNRKAIIEHFEKEGFKVFTTITDGYFQIVLKWNIV